MAVQTPGASPSFFGPTALLGIYVGVIPVALGTAVAAVDPAWGRGCSVMALTVGLLAFLVIDATLEGLELAAAGSQAFGGAALVSVGRRRRLPLADRRVGLAGPDGAGRPRGEGASGADLVFLVAVGISHNLGEGVATRLGLRGGGARPRGLPRRRLRAAQHHGRASRRSWPRSPRRGPPGGRLAALGLVAGAPAVVGAWIGAAAFHPGFAALPVRLRRGRIVQVIVQLTPSMRDDHGRRTLPRRRRRAALAGDDPHVRHRPARGASHGGGRAAPALRRGTGDYAEAMMPLAHGPNGTVATTALAGAALV